MNRATETTGELLTNDEESCRFGFSPTPGIGDSRHREICADPEGRRREVSPHFFYGVFFFRAIPKSPRAKPCFALIEEACLMTIQTPIPRHGPGKPKPILISMAQLCLMLSVSESTVNRWIRTFPDFPQALRFPSGTIRFYLAEVEAFIAGLPRCEFDDHGFNPNGR